MQPRQYDTMNVAIYKEVQFDASHRLLHYNGKCANLHGHRWKVEVWVEGEPDATTGILIDYNVIREIIEKFDHQILLNAADPMAACIEKFQRVITTTGDPTSELLAARICDDLCDYCRAHGIHARVTKIRVWESPTCFAELISPDSPVGTADEDR
jgi:6-pyruvoyltetrahydropterin/6-carboxytetrahydropterin synthase